MAVDGIYTMIVPSPMGKQTVIVTLVSNGADVSGTINMFKKVTPFTGGTCDGNNVHVKTVIKSAIGRFAFEVNAVCDGVHLEGKATTPFGKVDLVSVA